MLARAPSWTSRSRPASKLRKLPFVAPRDPSRMKNLQQRSHLLEPRGTKLVVRDRRFCCRKPRLVLPIGRRQAPRPRKMLVCQKQNGRRSLRSSTVESGDARSSTVLWGAGSETHVEMLISVSSVGRTTLGTGTTEFTASQSLPGTGSTRRLLQSRSARMMQWWIHC